MDKVEGQLSPSYEHFLIPQTTKWNEWFWIFAFLAAGTLVVAAVNLRGVLKGARWRPHKGCGKGLIQAKPRSHYVLPSGDKIPSMALGVGNAGKGEVGQAVKAALAAGYRHIDGAWAYPNEQEVGNAIKESGIPREDIFITSKLWNTRHAPEDIEQTVDESLSRLQTSYLDLYLIHWPVAFKKELCEKERKIVVDEALTADPYPTWKKLEELVDKGKIRNIGISNFNVWRYENLASNHLKYLPAVNQVELNFGNPQPELLAWAKLRGVLLEAYSPLGAREAKETLELPIIKKVAKVLGITPAQAILSWQAQRGVVVAAKSVHEGRIQENFKIVTLPQEHFDLIERAAVSKRPHRVINLSEEWDLGYNIFD